MSTASLVELKSRNAGTEVEANPGSTSPAAEADAPTDAPVPATAVPTRVTRIVNFLGGKHMIVAAVSGALFTLVWIALFTFGLTVNTEPFRTRLVASPTPPEVAAISTFEAILVVAVCFTPTNLVLLCCSSALIGCLGRLATTNGRPVSSASKGKGTNDADPAGVSPLAPAVSAIVWGFFVYLVLISGTLVVDGDPFSSTSAAQYLRLAGSASLLAFVVGWQPHLVTQLVANVGGAKFLRTPQKSDDASST